MGLAIQILERVNMYLSFLFFLILAANSLIMPSKDNFNQETTWDPWTPCQEDTDCPEDLMCNIYQSRCTECMGDEDCPPCLEDDCPIPGDGVCVLWRPLLLPYFMLT